MEERKDGVVAIGMRERKKAQTRGALIAAGRKLFVSRGLDGASMESVAAEADVSTPSLYNYFASKDELLAAIIVEDMAGGIARAQAFLAKPAKAPRPAYVALIRIYFEAFNAIDRTMLRRFTAHAIGREARADRDYFGVESQLMAQLGGMTAALQASGAIAPERDAELLTRAVFSIANSEYYAFVASDEARPEQTIKLIAAQIDLIFDGR